MIIIGEKINGTRNAVAEAIRERDTETIGRLALTQVEGGAACLDVNAGTPPNKEPEDLAWLVETIQSHTNIPLCLDSPNPRALLAAIRRAARLPMINSVSGERARVERLLPIACENKTDLVLLALDDSGIPKTAEERLKIVTRLVSLARKGGLRDEQLYVDPLVTTIATDRESGRVALEAIRHIRKRFPGVHITCGLSNISFGLPMRTLINQAFLALAMEAGLDSAIMDPTDNALRNMIYSADLVLSTDPDCMRYNEAYRSGAITLQGQPPDLDPDTITDAFHRLGDALFQAGLLTGGDAPPSGSLDPAKRPEKGESPEPDTKRQDLDLLVSHLVEMKRDAALQLTERLLEDGADPLEILAAARRAMGEVGRLFEEEDYFIPELILAGKMLKGISERLKPHLAHEVKGRKKGRVLIGTVAGDIHDIGKDIVVTMLDVNGYEVLDLGVDVPIERFVEAALSFKPQVVGLSGFLTLVYDPMRETIRAIREGNLGEIRFMIGGGQIDEQVRVYTGADGYGRDAIEAVRLCEKWI